MPTADVSRRVDDRLHELYQQHARIDESNITSYYLPGRGYYGPEQAGPERGQFAVCLATADGELFHVGDDELPFALQSISKVFTYGLALDDHGRDYVLERVGVEPSGDAFHSIVFDERHNRPYNPMVNAGALVTTDLVRGKDPAEQLERILALLRCYAGSDDIEVDEETFAGELQTADRNRATAYLMRSQGMLDGDVEAILRLYLQQCSVRVNCRQLAVMGATLANGCVNPFTGERALARERVRDLLSVMYTCGMYDFAGQWAYQVGIPAKSGVSGGIVAVVPGKMGIAVFSPGLDVYGNSVRGIRVCEEISARRGLHIFATDEEDAILGPGAEPR